MPTNTIDRALPLQQQILGELRSEIDDGLWVGRTGFYTEKEIAARFGVSLITSRAVLDRLAEEGFLDRGRGRRSIPIDRPVPQKDFVAAPLILAADRNFRYRLHTEGVSIAPREACRAFGMPAGSELWQCMRVRQLEGAVHSVTHNAQLPETGARHSAADLAQRPMFEILREQGEALSALRRRVSAIAPPQSIAALLGVKGGTPSLLYTCTVHRPDRSVIEWVRIYLNPDVEPGPEEFDLGSARWLSLNLP